jgi:hypothetical protein
VRIRWTTRIVTAVGVLTLIAGIAANGGTATSARAVGQHAATALILHWNGKS